MVTANRTSTATPAEFVNEAVLDFSDPTHASAQAAALRRVESELGTSFPLIIGGERRMTAETFASINPAEPTQVVARFAKASAAEADEAIQVARRTFQTWQYTAASERAGPGQVKTRFCGGWRGV